MEYKPFNYEQINIASGTYSPSSIKAFNNQTFAFWERALFQRALSVIDITLPEEWTGSIRDLFYYLLFKYGYTAVFNLPEYGNTFNPASLSGFDWYYRPTEALIANPALKGKSLKLKIGEECAIIKLTPDYRGIWDIIEYYAEKLSTLDNAINMSLVNMKFAFFLGAKNKAMGEALKKMLDLANKGEPLVIFDRKLADDPNSKNEPWQMWDMDLKSKYLTTDQLRDFSTILNNYDNEIGIPTLPVPEKKERMISAEATARVLDACSRSDIWIDSINSSAQEANRLFGLNISARRSYDIMEDTQNVDNETDPDRSI